MMETLNLFDRGARGPLYVAITVYHWHFLSNKDFVIVILLLYISEIKYICGNSAGTK
jgi:hypothetical protein